MKRSFLLVLLCGLVGFATVAKAEEPPPEPGEVTIPDAMKPSGVAATGLAKAAPYVVTALTVLLLVAGIGAAVALSRRVLAGEPAPGTYLYKRHYSSYPSATDKAIRRHRGKR